MGAGGYGPAGFSGPLGPRGSRMLDPRGHPGEPRLAPPPGSRGYYTGQNSMYGNPREDGGHVPSRHQLVEINLNKAITKKLASSVHYQRVGFPMAFEHRERSGRETWGWDLHGF
jgi:hypothetical protein